MSRGTVWCRWPLLSPRNTLHLSSHNNRRDKCSSLFVSTLRLLSILLTICGPEAIRTIPTFTGGYLTQLSFQLGRVSHLPSQNSVSTSCLCGAVGQTGTTLGDLNITICQQAKEPFTDQTRGSALISFIVKYPLTTMILMDLRMLDLNYLLC